MNPLTIDIEDMNTSFQPGRSVRGQVQWQLAEAPKKAGLRLLWYTAGKGTEDVGIVQTLEFDNPVAVDTRRFDFTFPAGPYSFSGQLVSLTWTLELEAGGQCLRQDITMSPSGRDIQLYPEAIV
jgi:hypothetical protein